MRNCRNRKTGVWLVLAVLALFANGARAAGLDQNKVAAFLVFPYVVAETTTETSKIVETLLTVTNTSFVSYQAHVVFINGNELDSHYCHECGFDISIVGGGSHTILVARATGVTFLRDLTSGEERTCTASMGFVTVDIEDFGYNALTDNVLLGNSVTIDYTSGTSINIEAIPLQGEVGNGDRYFSFDDMEYRKLPSVIAADFIAPDSSPTTGIGAELILFTLGFQSRVAPFTDCNIIGFDAVGQQFSTTTQFGCWTRRRLADIDPEFTYPLLGSGPGGLDEHGGLLLQCSVAGTGAGNPGIINGGVHGVLLQTATSGSRIRRNVPGPTLAGAVRWGRVLTQSQTVGDSVVLQVDPPPFPAPGGPQP